MDLIELINTFVYVETGVQTEILKSSTITKYLKDVKHSIVKHFTVQSATHWPTLLKQPRSGMFHPHPQTYRLHAWKLCNKLMSREAFQDRLRLEWHDPQNSPASLFTRGNGEDSVDGVMEGIPIHSRLM